MGSSNFLKELRRIAGKDNFFDSPAELSALCAWPRYGAEPPAFPLPEAAARPATLAQAREILGLCRSQGRRIIIRGAGTRPLRPLAAGEWIILLTGAMSRVLDIDEKNRLASLQAGAPLGALGALLRGRGLFFPAPGALRGTAGGAVAADDAWEGARKYGSVGSRVRELEILDGSGSRYLCAAQNGQPGKIAPAFPLAPLFCGSRGCLGLIGAVVLELLPAPERTECLEARFAGAIQAAEACARLAGAPALPDALGIADAAASALAFGEDRATLRAAYSGSAREAGAAAADAAEILKRGGALEIKACGSLPDFPMPAALGKWRESYRLCRVAAPASGLAAIAEALPQIARGRGAEALFYGGPEDIAVAFSGGDAEGAARDLFALELALAKRLQSEEDAGAGKGAWAERNAGLAAISGKIRAIFDPDGLFSAQPLPGAEFC